jgi:ABC-type nitrate/sulfonate/bicarbonate transport system ATPase subunit
MATVEEIANLLFDLTHDVGVAEKLARQIVALNDEPTKETRVLTVAEKR